MPRQWENTSSAPVQTPRSRKAGLFVCLSVSFKDTSGHFWPRHGSLWGKKSLYFKLAFFLTPVQKLPEDKPHPIPHPHPEGIVLLWSQLGNLVSTWTFKKIWGQIQEKIFFSHKCGPRHTMLCGLFVCFFHQQLVLTKQANALKKKKKSFTGHYSSDQPWRWIHSELINSDKLNQKLIILTFKERVGSFSIFLKKKKTCS